MQINRLGAAARVMTGNWWYRYCARSLGAVVLGCEVNTVSMNMTCVKMSTPPPPSEVVFFGIEL